MLDIGTYKQAPATVNWAIPHAVQEQGITAVIGPPNIGKTLAVIDMCCAVASGTACLANIPAQQGNVLYLSTEPIYGIRSRIEAWQQYKGVTFPEANFLISRSGVVNINSDFEEILEAVKTYNIAVVVIDTWSLANTDIQENSADDNNAVIGKLNEIRYEAGCSFIIVHHTGKTGESGRGSNSVLAAVDVEILVEPTDYEVAEYDMQMRSTKMRNERTWGKRLVFNRVPVNDSIVLEYQKAVAMY